jgi:hypothetical protein
MKGKGRGETESNKSSLIMYTHLLLSWGLFAVPCFSRLPLAAADSLYTSQIYFYYGYLLKQEKATIATDLCVVCVFQIKMAQ